MESGLTFNQLICEFESRRPRQKDRRQKVGAVGRKNVNRKLAMAYVGLSLTAERCTVNADK